MSGIMFGKASKVYAETTVFLRDLYERTGALTRSWFNHTGVYFLLNVLRDHIGIENSGTVWALEYMTRNRHRVDTMVGCAYLTDYSIQGL